MRDDYVPEEDPNFIREEDMPGYNGAGIPPLDDITTDDNVNGFIPDENTINDVPSDVLAPVVYDILTNPDELSPEELHDVVRAFDTLDQDDKDAIVSGLPQDIHEDVHEGLDNYHDIQDSNREPASNVQEAIDQHPEIADYIAENPEVADAILDNPAVADVIAENPQVADIISEQPQIAEVIAATPAIGDAIIENPEIAN